MPDNNKCHIQQVLMGIQAFSVAKEALGHAIKSAKDAIDKK